ncbi:hypothetical protein D3C72_1712680 [compost metagenome]
MPSPSSGCWYHSVLAAALLFSCQKPVVMVCAPVSNCRLNMPPKRLRCGVCTCSEKGAPLGDGTVGSVKVAWVWLLALYSCTLPLSAGVIWKRWLMEATRSRVTWPVSYGISSDSSPQV